MFIKVGTKAVQYKNLMLACAVVCSLSHKYELLPAAKNVFFWHWDILESSQVIYIFYSEVVVTRTRLDW